MNRREVFSNSAKALFGGLATPFLLHGTDPANALLLRFPVDDPQTQPLKNKYHFLRAGTSELELEGIYSTNPLFLTNRDNALSQQGYDCLGNALTALKETSLPPTIMYHSLAANGMDTGDYLARELRLGRDRLLPEFTYLDQRGIGLWDSSDETVVRPAVWALDAAEAGTEGFEGRPPANTDGTPNDTLHDQFTRLRQFLSLQETRTAGDIILVIFPDGTGPALLSCMIAGIPYQDVHALEFQPGELRMDITPESIRALYDVRKNDPTYLKTIEDGTAKLRDLRELEAKDFSVSYKDSQANEQQEEDNKAFYEQQKEANAEKLKVEEERQAAMQEQLRVSREKAREKEDQRQREALAVREQKDQKIRAQQAKADKRKAEQQAAYVAKKAEGKQSSPVSSPFGELSPIVLGAAGVGVMGMAAMLGGNDNDNAEEEDRGVDGAVLVSESNGNGDGDDVDPSAVASAEATAATAELSTIPAAETPVVVVKPDTDLHHHHRDAHAIPASAVSLLEVVPDTSFSAANENETTAEFTTRLEAAEQDMKDALVEAAVVKENKKQQQTAAKPASPSPNKPPSLYDNDPPVTITTKITKTTNFVYEDDEDDSAWLQVLNDIRDEAEEEDDLGPTVDYAALANNDDEDSF